MEIKSNVINGVRKTRYWTPDGREILAAPSMRDYNHIKNGKVVDSGTRDANLDKGWLLQPPTEHKLYCEHCDQWHDTVEEIRECGAKRKAFNAKWDKKAKAMSKTEDSIEKDVDTLKSEMSEIKAMLMKLLEAK